ncbi:MAG: DUF2062 domain-containing protein [Breznakibacter sp.]|nr:DUF2062 domain-containing protein [Breznakibacter sp.]
MMEWKERLVQLKCLVLIPTYNNNGTIAKVISEVKEYASDVLVVNDGSTDNTEEIISGINGISIISYKKNRGKGYALKTGLKRARQMGFRYAITIDSDGQHYPSDIPVFIEQIEQTPDSLIIGARNLNAENMPGKNSFANKFSNFWFKVETGITLADTQSGFRLYPLAKLERMKFITPRYEFEVEVIVKAAWRGVNVINIPIRVFYPNKEERISHFRPLQDFTRISILNTFLVTIALLFYYPLKFIRSITIENIKNFIKDNITHSKESNAKVAASIGLGVFFGIVPLWGYQMISAGITAHLLKLNKVLTIAASNISMPPMLPFILLGSVITGGLVMNNPTILTIDNISFESLSASFYQYLIGSVLLATASGLFVALISYITLKIFKRS